MTNGKTIMGALLLLVITAASPAYAANINQPAAAERPITLVDMRDVVHDESTGTIVHSTSGACVRTQWSNNYDICSTEIAVAPPAVRTRTRAMTLSREERTIYFGFNLASLSPEMKQRLDTLAAAIKSSRNVKGARIVGYADRIGNPTYNEKLSKKRAESARRYLLAKGVINMQIADTRWFGSSEPVSHCPGDLKRSELIECLQKDRRVEVEIDYFPDAQVSQAEDKE